MQCGAGSCVSGSVVHGWAVGSGPNGNAASERRQALGRGDALWRRLPRSPPSNSLGVILQRTLDRGVPSSKPRRHTRRGRAVGSTRGPRQLRVPSNWCRSLRLNVVKGFARLPRRLHAILNPPSNLDAASRLSTASRAGGDGSILARIASSEMSITRGAATPVWSLDTAALGGLTPPDHAAPDALMGQVEPRRRVLPRVGALQLLLHARRILRSGIERKWR